MDIGKILIYLGIALIALGTVFIIINKIFPVGNLPGDLHWQWGQTKVYFPVVSCLAVSVIATVLINLFFKR